MNLSTFALFYFGTSLVVMGGYEIWCRVTFGESLLDRDGMGFLALIFFAWPAVIKMECDRYWVEQQKKARRQ